MNSKDIDKIMNLFKEAPPFSIYTGFKNEGDKEDKRIEVEDIKLEEDKFLMKDIGCYPNNTKFKNMYTVMYKEVGSDRYEQGIFSFTISEIIEWISENLVYVKRSKKAKKDIVDNEDNVKDKVVEPLVDVDIDKMERNILIGLLNARKECTEQNILTVRGCVAIIDALFYLVKETSTIMAGIDKGGNING